MTEQTNANVWPSHTGILCDVVEGQGAKEAYVRFKIEIAYKDVSKGTFKKSCIAFKETIADVLALGEGTRVRVRGPVDTNTKTMDDGSVAKFRSMVVRAIENKPLVDASEGEAQVAASVDTVTQAEPVATVEADANAVEAVKKTRKPRAKKTAVVIDANAIDDSTAMGAALKRAVA